MRFAKIVNNTVDNIILADQDFIIKLQNYSTSQGVFELWVNCTAFPDCAIGWTYNPQWSSFSAPVVEPAVQPVDPCEWLIDLGPFFDRFGPQISFAVEMSTDLMVQALLRDFSRRKWIDLMDPRVSSAIDLLVLKVPGVTTALKASVLTTPVVAAENMALRKTYFS